MPSPLEALQGKGSAMNNEMENLPEHPRIRVSYHVIPMDEERIQFRNGPDAFIVKGQRLPALVRDLLPLLNGALASTEILERLSPDHSPQSVARLIRSLVQRRVVEENAQRPCHPHGIAGVQETYFRQFTKDPGCHLSALSRASILVVGLGPLGLCLADILARSGVGEICGTDDGRVEDDDIRLSDGYGNGDRGALKADAFARSAGKRFPDTRWTSDSSPLESGVLDRAADYLVVCLEKYRPDILSQVNDHSLRSGIPFVWCCMDGHCATVGPTVLPRETACFQCYTTRVKANADHPEALQAYEDHLVNHGNTAVFGYLPPHIQTLAGLAALEVVKDLSGLTPPLTYNAQLEMNLLNMEFELHPVLRLPRCPSCSRLADSGAVVRPFMERVI